MSRLARTLWGMWCKKHKSGLKHPTGRSSEREEGQIVLTRRHREYSLFPLDCCRTKVPSISSPYK